MIRVAAVMTALALVACTKALGPELINLSHRSNHIEVSVGAYLIDFEKSPKRR